MRYAGPHDPADEHGLGIEATQVFPALGPEPPRRTRLNQWVIAAASLTGAVAAYIAFTTAGVPARPMPSPFTPVTAAQSSPGGAAPRTPRAGTPDSRGAAASQASRLPVNCATPLPGPRSLGCAR
jgi:hypothetical protein